MISANGAPWFGDSRKLTRTPTDREHRLPSPQRGRGAGGEGDRGAVSVSSDEKSSLDGILTIAATLVRFRIAKMGDVGETVHGQAAGRARPMKTRRMEREDGCVNHVPFVCNDDAVVFNRVADLPSHDQPELSAFGMIVSAILYIEGRQDSFRSRR